jgi:hypothetical protein
LAAQPFFLNIFGIHRHSEMAQCGVGFFFIVGEGGIKSGFVITKPDIEYLILERWESGSGNHGKEKDILIFHSNLSNDSTAYIRQGKEYYYF